MKSATERSDESLFEDDVLLRYPTLRGGRVWKREHDLILLRAVLKYVLNLYFKELDFSFLGGYKKSKFHSPNM